jgi:hypothetical protein
MALVTRTTTARMRSGEQYQEGCSDKGTTEGGHEPMITSIQSLNVRLLPG